MKVKLIKSGECAEVNDSYGERLIQQGQAVILKPANCKKPEAASAKKEARTAADVKKDVV